MAWLYDYFRETKGFFLRTHYQQALSCVDFLLCVAFGHCKGAPQQRRGLKFQFRIDNDFVLMI
jgi:hypothetical protein